MPTEETRSRALDLVRSLIQLLEGEDATPWSSRLRQLEAAGEAGDGPEEGLEVMRASLQKMHFGPGDFGDFHIWRESPQDMAAANQELERLRDTLWTVLAG